MTDPTTTPDTATATDETAPTPQPAPLQMLGAADADGCDDGTCAIPGDDER